LYKFVLENVVNFGEKSFAYGVTHFMSFLKKNLCSGNIEPWYLGYAFQGAVVLGSLPILLPVIVEYYTNDAIAGIVVAMFFAGQLIAPLWGRIADGTRRLKLFYLLGYILVGFGAFFFGISHNEAFWMILAFLQGMGAAATNTISAMFIVEFNAKKEWNRRIGWLQTFYGVGQAFGLGLAAILSVTPVVGVIISGVLMIPGFLFGRMHLPVEEKLQSPKQGIHLDGVDINHIHSFSFVSHFHIPSGDTFTKFAAEWKSKFALFMLIWFLTNLSRGLVYDLFPLLMKNLFRIHPGISALYYAVAAGICVFLYAPAGKMGNKFGIRNVALFGVIMTFISIALMFLCSILPLGGLSWLLALLSFMILPCSWAPLIVAGTSLATEFATMETGSALGFFNLAYAVGVVLSAFIAGALAVSFGYRTILCLALIIGFVCILLFIKLNSMK
jgi:MFS transporter, DHA1 family, tetracycline resistance protein